MKSIARRALLPVILACCQTGACSQEIEVQPDKLCQMLFDAYIVGGGKINTSTYLAASHIIAERGRGNGFWKEVLKELRSENEVSEAGCVLILGKMLETDAAARDVIRKEKETGEVGQWRASVCLAPEVVSELVSRGKEAEGFRIDQYAEALARARAPEATDFFRMILQDDAGKQYMDGAKFHAVLGLAQVGDALGYEWLIKHSDTPLSTVSGARPSLATDRNLNTCCMAALHELSGNTTARTRQEWELWWEQLDKESIPRGCVMLGNP